MWARVVEIMLGFWLMASPFIFRGIEMDGIRSANETLCGLLVAVLGFLSFWNPTRWAHFLTLLVAGFLIVSGYLAGHPAPPMAQNQIMVGLLLGMFAIIPNRTNEMPEPWRRFYDRNKYDEPGKETT